MLGAGIGLTLFVFAPAGPLTQITRSLAAVAEVAEGGAQLTTAALRMGTDVTTGVSEAAAASAIISTSKSLGQDVWNGILYHITSVRMRRIHGKVIGNSRLALDSWATSEPGSKILPREMATLRLMSKALSAISLDVPCTFN